MLTTLRPPAVLAAWMVLTASTVLTANAVLQEHAVQPDASPATAVFASVRRGLTGGDVNAFAPSLALQVYVSLRTGEHGYYSASQASVLLDYFLRTRKISNLVFSTVNDNATVPYATGSATLLYRGNRQLVQVYVAAARTGDRWVITQLNIY